MRLRELVDGGDEQLGEVQDELEDSNKKVDDEREQREQKRKYELQKIIYRVHGSILAFVSCGIRREQRTKEPQR